MNLLDEAWDDTAAIISLFLRFRKRLRTTNGIERLNQEIRRRERVIHIFPNEAFALRLIGALLIEQDEKWSTGRKYFEMEGYYDSITARKSLKNRWHERPFIQGLDGFCRHGCRQERHHLSGRMISEAGVAWQRSLEYRLLAVKRLSRHAQLIWSKSNPTKLPRNSQAHTDWTPQEFRIWGDRILTYVIDSLMFKTREHGFTPLAIRIDTIEKIILK